MSNDPIYALAVMIPEQEQIITKHCFGDCGKIIIGGVEIEGVAFAVCRTSDCPYLDRQMDEPMGDVDGSPVYVRKLKEVKP